jgi:hypothetical protein
MLHVRCHITMAAFLLLLLRRDHIHTESTSVALAVRKRRPSMSEWVPARLEAGGYDGRFASRLHEWLNPTHVSEHFAQYRREDLGHSRNVDAEDWAGEAAPGRYGCAVPHVTTDGGRQSLTARREPACYDEPYASRLHEWLDQWVRS